MSGKGSTARPFAVDQDTFGANWDACFGGEPKKACTGCHEQLPFSAFNRSKTTYKSRCRACEKAANAERWRNMPADQKAVHMARSAAWAKNNPESRKRTRARNYSKDPSASLKRKHAWKGYPEPTRPIPSACELCDGPATGRGSFHLDHCHETNAFRGWLCSRCNHGLGLLGDNLTLVIARVSAYRERTFGGAKAEASSSNVEVENGNGSQSDQSGQGAPEGVD